VVTPATATVTKTTTSTTTTDRSDWVRDLIVERPVLLRRSTAPLVAGLRS
jgi:hypothetical protein